MHLYLFVDESNTHSPPGQYVVAGCWCLSPYERSTDVARASVDRLKSDIEGLPDGELKGEALEETTLNSVFAYLRNARRDDRLQDDSLATGDVPWRGSSPLAFTTYDSDSTVLEAVARAYLGEHDDGTPPQVLALASVITPMFYLPEQTTVAIDERRVVLDAKTWERPSYTLRSLIERAEVLPTLRFRTRDSDAIPGIQLADLAANLRRRQLRNGACDAGAAALNELRV